MRFSVSVTPRRALVALAGIAALGLLVALSGIVNIGASSGHWGLTSWALHGVMESSIRTYALLEPEPPADLDSPSRVRRAAGHFETACAFCHGSPLHPRPQLAAHMTPVPPALDEAAAKWRPRELARIVRHGVKYTGMPSWPALRRDDEIWSMVAFLRALPGLSGAQYRAVAFGPGLPQDHVLEGCARCHGVDGSSSDGAFPVIGGQSDAYLLATLRAFANDARPSGFMQLAVDGLSGADLESMARHYAGRAGVSERAPSDETSPGARIARHGLPEADVPACESCHGASGRRNPGYPRLAGQDAGYLAGQLRLFRQGRRGGATGYADVMQKIAERLPDAAIDAVARFYARETASSGSAGRAAADGKTHQEALSPVSPP